MGFCIAMAPRAVVIYQRSELSFYVIVVIFWDLFSARFPMEGMKSSSMLV